MIDLQQVTRLMSTDVNKVSISINQRFLSTFLHSEAFESNTTSDWLNHVVYPVKSCVTFKENKISKKWPKNVLGNGW